MAIGSNSLADSQAQPTTKEVIPQTQVEFLFLREILAALDVCDLSLSLAISRITNAKEGSEDLHKFFEYVKVIDPILVSAQDLQQKINEAAVSVEGALQAVSALELSRRAAELSQKN